MDRNPSESDCPFRAGWVRGAACPASDHAYVPRRWPSSAAQGRAVFSAS